MLVPWMLCTELGKKIAAEHGTGPRKGATEIAFLIVMLTILVGERS